MRDCQTICSRMENQNILSFTLEQFDQIKPLITRIKRGDGYYTYTIPGTKLVSIQTTIDSEAEKIAHIEIRQQLERTGLTAQDIEKQFKDYNEACARIFR